VLGTARLDEFGRATLNTATLGLGKHTITALYSGDAGSVGSTSAALNLTVYNTAPALTVAASSNPTVEGAAVTFTATAAAGATPTGTVTFLDGDSSLGTGAFSSGAATFTTSGLRGGQHDIVAAYADDSNFTLSLSNTLAQTVQQTTTTTVVSSTNWPIE